MFGWGRFVQKRVIGTGASGEVWLCQDKLTQQQVAIKMIPVVLVNENTLRELRNHQLLSVHPHVVQFQGVFISESPTGSHLCIVMEYAQGGSVRSMISRHKSAKRQAQSGYNINEDLCRWCFQQQVLALYFCHQMQIVNRDIKPDNMLVMSPISIDQFNIEQCTQGDLSNAPVLKISDFGYSKNLDQDSKPASVVGTVTHIAPEIVQNLGHQSQGGLSVPYDAVKADIWSSGVSLYELLTGTTPFQREDDKEKGNVVPLILNRIVNLDYSFPVQDENEISDSAKTLVGSILVLDPKRRITIQQIFQHPWFRQDFPLIDPVGWTQEYVDHASQQSSLLSENQLKDIALKIELLKRQQYKPSLNSITVGDKEAIRIRKEQRLQRKQQPKSPQKKEIPMYAVQDVVDGNRYSRNKYIQSR
eukprot:TRINITY_DN8976_c1_g1_i3.p1 TRINITY_DN8976_c1_g1~~TRINITY_DN8976_c1_g1_i3.p1  ORF type:complete len:417 (+),score=19.23 TRINITY_DN8976_c1_g1_i3:81-1331(+)